jgi:hypothetical protein
MTDPRQPGSEPRDDELETALERWLTDDGTRAPDSIVESVAQRTRPIRQRPGWLARLVAPDGGARFGLVRQVVVAAAVLGGGVLIGVQAGLLDGRGGPGNEPTASPSATAAPSSASETLDSHITDTWPSGVTSGSSALWAFDSLWVGGGNGVSRLDGTGAVEAAFDADELSCGPLFATARSVWFGACGLGGAAGPDARKTLRYDAATNELANVYDDGAADGVGVANLGGGAWFISDVEHGVLTKIDEETGAEMARLELGQPVLHLTAGFGSLWVSPVGVDLATVLRIDPATGAILATVTLSGDAGYLTVGGDAIWVAEPFQWLLARIDPTTDRVAAEWGIGEGADQIVLDEAALVWVVAATEVVGIDINTGIEVERFSVPAHQWLGIDTHPLGAGSDSLWWAEGSVVQRLIPVIGE